MFQSKKRKQFLNKPQGFERKYKREKAPIRNHKFNPLYLDSASAPTFDSEEPAVSRFTDMIPTEQVIAAFTALDGQLRLPSDVTIPQRVKLTNGFI